MCSSPETVGLEYLVSTLFLFPSFCVLSILVFTFLFVCFLLFCRQFLTPSRIPPGSKTALFDRTFFRLDSSGPSSYRQSSRCYSLCSLPRGGWCEGVILYCCMAVENRFSGLSAVLRGVLREQRALCALRTFVQAGWWRWA